MQDETIERTFTIDGRCSLEVSNISGSVRVTGGDTHQVTIRARKESRNGPGAEATHIEIEQQGNRIVARTRFPQGGLELLGWLDGRNRPADVHYVVTCPRDTDAALHGVSCSLDVRSLRGSVTTNAVSGATTVEDVDGRLSMNTVSGNLTARRIRGDVNAKSVSGRVNVSESESAQMRGNSVSGDVSLETRRVLTGGASLSTVSGYCELSIPPQTPCTVTAHTVSGTVHCELPADVLTSKRTLWKARINGGGPEVTLNSVSGNFRIRTSAPGRLHAEPPPSTTFVEQEPAAAPESEMVHDTEPAAPPEPPEPPVPPVPPAAPTAAVEEEARGAAPAAAPGGVAGAEDDETMRILKAIERGEMSVDDGLSRLQEIESRQKE